MKEKRIKLTRYSINLAGDCFVDLEVILEALKQEGYIIDKKENKEADNE